MQNPWVVIISIAVLVFIGLIVTSRESFSQSGLTIDDDYCHKLSSVYVDPKNNDPVARKNYDDRICGKQRRYTIDDRFGNYFTMNGMLI
jgi:hypothetical protein